MHLSAGGDCAEEHPHDRSHWLRQDRDCPPPCQAVWGPLRQGVPRCLLNLSSSPLSFSLSLSLSLSASGQGQELPCLKATGAEQLPCRICVQSHLLALACQVLRCEAAQVEATKFTEVGFHGRDVDQIIRDLVDNAVTMVRQRQRHTRKAEIDAAVEKRILDALAGDAAQQRTRVCHCVHLYQI